MQQFPEIENIDIRFVHSILDMEAVIIKSKTGKAIGEDLIPFDIYKLAPTLFAQAFASLSIKVSAMLFEPVQAKGGNMIHIFKGRGEMTECDSSRGILLTSSLGKAMRAAGRVKLVPYAESSFIDTQLCGLPHRGTEAQIWQLIW